MRASSCKSLVSIAVSGALLALHWLTFFHAIQVSTVAIGLIGCATFPIFVTFLEPLLSSQRVRAVDVLSAFVVVIGLVLVAPRFDLSDSGMVGLIWAVVYGILFAAVFLSEIPGFQTVIGACLVFGAVVIAMRAHANWDEEVKKGG